MLPSPTFLGVSSCRARPRPQVVQVGAGGGAHVQPIQAVALPHSSGGTHVHHGQLLTLQEVSPRDWRGQGRGGAAHSTDFDDEERREKETAYV